MSQFYAPSQKTAVSYVTSVLPSIGNEQLCSRRTDFLDIGLANFTKIRR